MKRAVLFAVAGLVSATWAAAHPLPQKGVEAANPLGPATPSAIVTVSTFFQNACPGSALDFALARVFSRLEGSDGTASHFSIPPGKVLVVTGAEIEVMAPSPRHFLNVWLSMNTLNDANIMAATAVSDDFGIARLHYLSPTGTVVSSGVNVCLSARDVTDGTPVFEVRGILTGYLADDN